jgi:hypothetical protein
VALALGAVAAWTPGGASAQGIEVPRYARDVTVRTSPEQTPFAALELPSDVVDECDSSFFGDLYLVGTDGKDWPFEVDLGQLPKRTARPLSVLRTESGARGIGGNYDFAYTFDLTEAQLEPGEDVGEIHLTFRTPQPGRQFSVDSSNDGAHWTPVTHTYANDADAYVQLGVTRTNFVRVNAAAPNHAQDLVHASALGRVVRGLERGFTRKDVDLPVVRVPTDDDAVPGAPHRFLVLLPAARLFTPEFRVTTEPAWFTGSIAGFQLAPAGGSEVVTRASLFSSGVELSTAKTDPVHKTLVAGFTRGRVVEVDVVPGRFLGNEGDAPLPASADVTGVGVSYGMPRIVFRTPKDGRLSLLYGTTPGRPISHQRMNVALHDFLERPVEEVAEASLSAAPPPDDAPPLDRTPRASTTPPLWSMAGTAPEKGGLTFADIRCAKVPDDLSVIDAEGNAIPFVIEDDSPSGTQRRHMRKLAFSAATAGGETLLTVPLGAELTGDLGCEPGYGHFAVDYAGPRVSNIEAWQGPRPDAGSPRVLPFGSGDTFAGKLAAKPPLQIYIKHGQPRALPVSDVTLSTEMSRIYFVTKPGERVSLVRSGAPDAAASRPRPGSVEQRIVRAAAVAPGEALRLKRGSTGDRSGPAEGDSSDPDAARGVPKWAVGLGFLLAAGLCFGVFAVYLLRSRRSA